MDTHTFSCPLSQQPQLGVGHLDFKFSGFSQDGKLGISQREYPLDLSLHFLSAQVCVRNICSLRPK